MKYTSLIEPCKSCLGCERLVNTDFVTDKNCIWQDKGDKNGKQSNK